MERHRLGWRAHVRRTERIDPAHADAGSERGSESRGAREAAARTHRLRGRSGRARGTRVRGHAAPAARRDTPRGSWVGVARAHYQRRRGRSVGQPVTNWQHEPGTRYIRAAPVSKRTRRAARRLPPRPARRLPPRPGIRCSSAQATSDDAVRTTTRRPRPCSTGSPGPCSRPVTTPTRAARPSSSATATTRSWGRHRARTRPAPGNHDWETAGLAGYFGYFGDAAKGPGGSSWYSYDLGSWHVIVLDSTCEKVDGCDAASPTGSLAGGRSSGQPYGLHAGDLPCPAFQLGEARRLRRRWTPSGGRCTPPGST